ncbi:MAG: Ig-like domain-containing protein [Treponema sp.]|nr:Ig-like domain-containing protein [Treponema sp.]
MPVFFIIFCSLLLPACRQPSGGGDSSAVTSVTVTPAMVNVERGKTQQFSASVVVTGSAAKTVTWKLEGNKAAGTKLEETNGNNSTALLTVAAGETAVTLSVKAIATVDSGKSGAATVTVVAPGTSYVNEVIISPSAPSVVKGGSQQFTVHVKGSSGVSQVVTWSLEGPHLEGTTVNSSGLLTVAAGEAAATLSVKATSTADTSKSGMVTVKVAASKLPVPADLALSDKGVVTWTALTDEANVESYSIQIWKDGTPNTEEGDRITVTKGAGKTGTAYTHDLLSVLKKLEPAHYGISIKAIAAASSGVADSDDTDNGAEGAWQEVKKQTQAVNVWWHETTRARWVNVDGDSNYAVQLYKGETAVGSPVQVTRETTVNPGNPAETITTYDFTSAITTGGYGSYTFGVVTKGNGYLILDADEKKGPAYSYVNPGAGKLSAVQDLALSDKGVATWTALTDEANVESYSIQIWKGGTPNTEEGNRIPVAKGSGKTGTAYTHNLLSVLKKLEPAHYGISIKAIAAASSGVANSDDTDNTASAAWQQVKKPASVEYAWWDKTDKTVAHWDTVADVGNPTDYTVNVYQGGTKVAETTGAGTYTQDGKLKAYVDLKSQITQYGPGSYTFGVVTKGNGYLILDADEKKVEAAFESKNLFVTFTPANESASLVVTPTGPVSISKTGQTTSTVLTVTGTGFTGFTWVIDGVSVTGTENGITLSGDSKTLTITAADLKVGGHSVTVYALDSDNVPWSPASPIQFTVTAQ